MSNPQVTIVVVPRERFSYTEKSLNSIYENTDFPHNLVYVDGNSPTHIKRYLEKQSQEKGFELIRRNQFLTPNQARNLGLAQVKTKYVVFIDNDVLVKPGWLEKLVKTAESTNAWVVGPLCLEGKDFNKVHMVGGTSVFKEKGQQRWLVERRPFMRLPLEKVQEKIHRGSTEILEFHCMLVRCEAFEKLGFLDEKLMSMAEESDFSMSIVASGNKIYLEPESVITYVPPSPADLKLSDLPFFFVRWSDSWCQQSVERFREKWNLTEDALILKHLQHFVEAHRCLAYPKPKQMTAYPGYILRRSILSIVKEVMNRRASKIVLPQNTYSTNSKSVTNKQATYA